MCVDTCSEACVCASSVRACAQVVLLGNPAFSQEVVCAQVWCGFLVWPSAALPCIYEWHSAVLQYPRRQKHRTEGGTGGEGPVLQLGPPGQERCVGSVPKLVELYIQWPHPLLYALLLAPLYAGDMARVAAKPSQLPHVFELAAQLLGSFGLPVVGWHTCVLLGEQQCSPVFCVGCGVQTSRQQPLVGPCCCTPQPLLCSALAVLQTRGFFLQGVLFLFIRQSQQAGCTVHAAASWRAELLCWLCLPCLLCMQAAVCWQLRARWLSPRLLERIHVL